MTDLMRQLNARSPSPTSFWPYYGRDGRGRREETVNLLGGWFAAAPSAQRRIFAQVR
jgi:hypothetical protein